MADYKVLWTETALVDLEDIYDFIAKDSKEAAQRIIEQILNRESQLLSQPESGSIQKLKTIEQEYRFLVEGNYKLIYH